MNALILQLSNVLTQMHANLQTVLFIMALLFAVQIINMLLGYRLNILGIHPRRWYGLPGIFFAPFLHGSFNHLFFNAIPLFALLNFMLITGWDKFIHATAIIFVISGLLTWLFGRRGVHIGASGIIMGYWGYLLADAIQHPSVTTLMLGIISIYYFGGLFFNLFPSEERVSWEGHLFGFIAGLVAVYLQM